MPKPNKTLLGTIAKRAGRTFPGDLIHQDLSASASMGESENYILWLEHLLKEAAAFLEEVQAEGLHKTAQKVQEEHDYIHSILASAQNRRNHAQRAQQGIQGA